MRHRPSAFRNRLRSRHATWQSANSSYASRAPICSSWLTSLQQISLSLLGDEGHSRVVHTFRHLLQWIICVAILKLGSAVTFSFFVPPDATATTGMLSPVAIHHGIAYLGMSGFVLSQLLYEVESLARRIARIRHAWKAPPTGYSGTNTSPYSRDAAKTRQVTQS